MLNQRAFWAFSLLSTVIMCHVAMPPVFAEEVKPIPGIIAVEKGKWVVSDLVIDKTADNAVVARDQAIVEAKRQALQKLAVESLSPEELKNFKMPDDRVISSLVQDFEIGQEQLSTTRYVAKFTVRFQRKVSEYIGIVSPAVVETTAAAGTTISAAPSVETSGVLPVTATDKIMPLPSAGQGDGVVAQKSMTPTLDSQQQENHAAVSTKPKTILVLPYFENGSGKTVLWDGPNPWMNAWQTSPLEASGWNIVLPLGDIRDVSMGSPDKVWSGDYTVVEKLRDNYGADDVMVAIANTEDGTFNLDVHIFTRGVLKERQSLPVHAKDMGGDAPFKDGVDAVLAFLQKPVLAKKVMTASAKTEELPAKEIAAVPDVVPATVPVQPPTQAEQEAEAAMITASEPVTEEAPIALHFEKIYDAEMQFSKFSEWAEMQKRLKALAPSVKADIKSMSNRGAQFSLGYNGDIDTLRALLAERGIELGVPVIDVASDAVQTTQKTVYDVRLVTVQ